MRGLLFFSVLICMALAAGCGQSDEPPVLIVYHEGNEYQILDRGDTVAAGRPAYFVRYYSHDISDENVLATERSDLYTLIAKHIDTNKHQRVSVTAVERKGRLFGLMEPREVTENLTLDEVLKYHPDTRTSAAE